MTSENKTYYYRRMTKQRPIRVVNVKGVMHVKMNKRKIPVATLPKNVFDQLTERFGHDVTKRARKATKPQTDRLFLQRSKKYGLTQRLGKNTVQNYGISPQEVEKNKKKKDENEQINGKINELTNVVKILATMVNGRNQPFSAKVQNYFEKKQDSDKNKPTVVYDPSKFKTNRLAIKNEEEKPAIEGDNRRGRRNDPNPINNMISAQEEHITRLDNLVTNLRKEYDQVNEEMMVALGEKGKYENQAKKINIDIKKKEQQVKELTEEIKRSEEYAKNIRDALEGHSQKNFDLRKNVDDLKNDLKRSDEVTGALSKQRDKLFELLKQNKEDISRIQAKISHSNVGKEKIKLATYKEAFSQVLGAAADVKHPEKTTKIIDELLEDTQDLNSNDIEIYENYANRLAEEEILDNKDKVINIKALAKTIKNKALNDLTFRKKIIKHAYGDDDKLIENTIEKVQNEIDVVRNEILQQTVSQNRIEMKRKFKKEEEKNEQIPFPALKNVIEESELNENMSENMSEGISDLDTRELERNVTKNPVEENEGLGYLNEPGMTDKQLNKILGEFPGYQGCFTYDEMPKAIKHIGTTKPEIFSLLYLHKNKEYPNGHFCAIFCDTIHDSSFEYYNSFGEDDLPNDVYEKFQKVFEDKYLLKYMLKYKYSDVQNQPDKSANCGLYAAKFISDRYFGVPFKEATRYDPKLDKEFDEAREKFGFI